MSGVTDLSAELRTYLINALYAHPAEFRRNAHWVMSPEWWDECRRMTGPDGRVLLERTVPQLLLGKTVKVREDGGAPHLEAP